jgi:hypothetical protein
MTINPMQTVTDTTNRMNSMRQFMCVNMILCFVVCTQKYENCRFYRFHKKKRSFYGVSLSFVQTPEFYIIKQQSKILRSIPVRDFAFQYLMMPYMQVLPRRINTCGRCVFHSQLKQCVPRLSRRFHWSGYLRECSYSTLV